MFRSDYTNLNWVYVTDRGGDHLLSDELHYRFVVWEVFRLWSTTTSSWCLCQRRWDIRLLYYFPKCESVRCSPKCPSEASMVCPVATICDSCLPSSTRNGAYQSSGHWRFSGRVWARPGSFYLPFGDLLRATSGRSRTWNAWSTPSG